MAAPVFYDPSGRRRRWSMRLVLALMLLIVGTAAVFALTIIAVPVPPPVPITIERPRSRPLSHQVGRLEHHVARELSRLAAWLPTGIPDRDATSGQIVVGFYTPWDDASRSSLARHVGQLDWVVPDLLSVTGQDHRLTSFPDPRLDAIIASARHRPRLLPMVQNALDGEWDGRGAAALLHSPSARRHFLDQLDRILLAHHAAGAMFDIEALPATAQTDYKLFLAEARVRFSRHGWLITLAVPAGDPDWRLADYARLADKLFLMAYDEHWPGGEAGPIASQPWFVAQVRAALAAAGRDRIIVAIGNYAYDWAEGGETRAQSIEEAWLSAHDSGAPVRFDRASGNATFDYEEAGRTHHVWMLDAASAWNQLRAARQAGVGGVALWRLGTEDSGIWQVLAALRSGWLPELSTIRSTTNTDVEGTGEILRITDVPRAGSRTIRLDDQGLIRNEVYRYLPTPYVVQRTGYHPRQLALTFDDGPDGDWTPAILDILKARHVPATFFIVGEMAVAHPALLNAIIASGGEIGNHSYTHPNMAQVSDRGTRLELNTTQRLVEAYTGRATRLFRAPYFGDAEPTTADELVPALVAQDNGYLNIGLHVDPGDWKRPGADAIVERTIHQVMAGNAERSGLVILLHDGGGDRSQTVAALPRIIDGLRARGYSFVPVSALAGLSRADAMPRVTGSDLFAVRTDVGIFLTLAAFGRLLKYLFFVAITLGIGRALLMAALAVANSVAGRRSTPPSIDPRRLVSVLIPAFNEARVIEASVRRVLASEKARIEVIVIDDGSTDGTGAIVTKAFAEEPRVRLLSLPNGGKAAALNHALREAGGDIVVALDADTQFEPLTIARLARWFDDPAVGAIAGNAKVGNPVNLVTRWQAVEYVTAQNLERRALTRLDAITVVPGAVGAWRRAALDNVGGYPVDTLAEDQDLTIAIQKAGWHVGYDVEAIAWTEAPESFHALARQRFRWAFGTLQCLWKHRAILRHRRPAGLALVGLPQAWLFQIGFALVSPIIDLALLLSLLSTILRVHQHGWAQTQSDVLRMGAFWIAFTTIDIVCGWIAYRLEPRETRYPALLLVVQRFIYRQLMYSVVIRAVGTAIRGLAVGWGKLERSGRVAPAPQPATGR